LTAIFSCDQILAFARSQFMNIDIFAEHFSELEDPHTYDL